MADIIILKSSFCETLPYIPQIAEQHLIRATITAKTNSMLLEKFPRNKIHPVERSRAEVF